MFELRLRTGVPKRCRPVKSCRAQIDVPAGAAFGTYGVALEIQRLNPPSVLWPGDDIVIVPRP